MVSVKAIGRRIEFFGINVAESTAYFTLLSPISNFLFIEASHGSSQRPPTRVGLQIQN